MKELHKVRGRGVSAEKRTIPAEKKDPEKKWNTCWRRKEGIGKKLNPQDQLKG